MKTKVASILLLSAAKCLSVAADEAVDTVELQSVTVTAIKGGSSVSAAASVSTINAAEARRLHIESLKGAADVVPNMFVPDYGSRITSSIYVRGIGARMDQPAVGLNVDNVPFLNKDAYDFDLQDIKDLQVLRGPQSTLYGRNTMAGVVNINTLSPLDYQGLRAMAEYGRANTWKAGVSYYKLLSNTFGVSGSVRVGGSDGFFKNAYNGEKCDYEHSVSARIKAQWRPSSSFSLLNTLAISGLKQGGYPYEFVENSTIAYNDTCSYNRLSINDGLTMRWQTGNVLLSSISSWQYINDEMRLDQDFLPIDYFTLIQAKHENAFTQDFVAASSPSDTYSWLAGLFGFYKYLNMGAPVTFKDTGISQLIEEHRNEANPLFPIRWNDREFVLASKFINPIFGFAAYHKSSFKLRRFTIEGALRLDYEHAALKYKSFTSTSYAIMQTLPSGDEQYYRDVPILIDEAGRLSRSFWQLLPKLSATYSVPGVDGSLDIFASISKGYKSGGYNTQMFSDVLQQQLMWMLGVGMQYDINDIVSYRPEKSWNYEVGVKYNCPAAHLQVDFTLFYIDVTDQQLTMFPDGSTTGRVMANAGKTHSFGGEISLRWHQIKALEVLASYGSTTAKFRDFFDGREQYMGKRVPYAPANTIFGGVTYTHDINETQAIIANLNLRANGKIYWNEQNTLSQPLYALLGASLAYRYKDFTIEAWGKNLTNTYYHTFYFVSIGHEFVQRGKPWEIGVTLNLSI